MLADANGNGGGECGDGCCGLGFFFVGGMEQIEMGCREDDRFPRI